MSKYTFILALIILALLGGLGWSANQGNPIALIGVGVALAVSLISLGVLLTILVIRSSARSRQADINNNLQENLAYLSTMHRIQSGVFRDQQKYLPAPNPEREFNLDASLQYEESVFNGLDTGGNYPQEQE